MRKKAVIIGLSTIASLAFYFMKKNAQQPPITLNGDYPLLEKAQHAVFYVKDLNESEAFYRTIFDLQYSATNHPNSSAAMKLVGHTMKFFSFGHYHHDICFVQNPEVHLDEEQWSHFTVKLADSVSLEEIISRIDKLKIPYEEGHVLPQLEGTLNPARVIHFKDPNGHIIEVVA